MFLDLNNRRKSQVQIGGSQLPLFAPVRRRTARTTSVAGERC